MTPKQYCSMQRAILAALEELLGDEWTNEYQEAWACKCAFAQINIPTRLTSSRLLAHTYTCTHAQPPNHVAAFGFITHVMIKAAHEQGLPCSDSSPKANSSAAYVLVCGLHWRCRGWFPSNQPQPNRDDKSLGACPMPFVANNKFLAHAVRDDHAASVDAHMHRPHPHHQRPAQKQIQEES